MVLTSRAQLIPGNSVQLQRKLAAPHPASPGPATSSLHHTSTSSPSAYPLAPGLQKSPWLAQGWSGLKVQQDFSFQPRPVLLKACAQVLATTPLHAHPCPLHHGQAGVVPGAPSPPAAPAPLTANPSTKTTAWEGPCTGMFAKHSCVSSSGSRKPGCTGSLCQTTGEERCCYCNCSALANHILVSGCLINRLELAHTQTSA